MAIDNTTLIPAGLRADIMRSMMENKNLLSSKGAIYYGTGNSATFGDKTVYETKALIPSSLAKTNSYVICADATDGLKFDQIGTSAIKDSAITTSKINNKAVTTAKIDDGAISAVKISDSAVTTAKINNSAVTAAKLASSSVETAKIKDSAVTNAKLAHSSITLGGVTINLGDTKTTLSGFTSITSTKFLSGSDLRLKENVVDYEYKNSILDIPVKEFDYKDSKIHTIGFIAQDLQEYFPELVTEDEEGYLQIAETKLIYLLLEEVKKLKEQIKK